MDNVKVFLNETLSANVICPKCGNLKQINFQGKVIPRSGIAKCKCGNNFTVLFEKRKYYRKHLDLTATCFTSGDPVGFLVKLVDISQGGISFSTSAGRSLQLDVIIKLSFQLEGDTVNCVASVCSIRDQRVGAKFKNMDAHSTKTLRFFLMP